MRKNWLAAISLGALTLAALAFGETYTEDGTEASAATGSSTTAEVPFESRVFGSVDVRPGLYLNNTPGGDTKYGFENGVELGATITDNISMSYHQDFNVNIDGRASSGGADVYAQDGFLRTKFNNLWVSDSGDSTLSYQNRLYAPTNAAKRDAGLVTYVRNYVTLNTRFSESFSLATSIIPIFHFYDKAGVVSKGKAKANPAFENRVYVIPTVNLTSALSFTAPVMFHQTRHRSFQNADDWSFVLWTWPEVDYKLDANNTIGLAYYTDNLVKSDLSGFDFDNGFGNGVFQAVYMLNI